MARRILFLLLTGAIGCLNTGCALWPFHREAKEEAPVVVQREEPGRIIEPEVERRTIKQPKIDHENFEVGVYGGILSLEDFGSNPVYGVRAAYHIAEDLFVEGAFARSEAGLSSIERLANVRVTQNRDYTYYNLSFGYNFLPGEIFLGKNRALTSSLYVIGGVGGTRFAGDDLFTINLGLGFRVLANDWLAFHIDARNHRFATDLLGSNKAVNNLEGTVGVTVFF